MFYVLFVLCVELCCCGVFVSKEVELCFDGLFDFVVFGIVVDVVWFDGNNCVLVVQGLQCICNGCMQLGIVVLFCVVGCEVCIVLGFDFGFGFGLCLNVVGWLFDMLFGIECLIIDDIGCVWDFV